MNYEQALEILKRGGKVSRGGKMFQIQRGITDVTDPADPKRVFVDDSEGAQPGLGEEARAANDWEEAPDVVAPDAVDEVFAETQEES